MSTSSTACTETALTLWEETLLKVLQEAIEKDLSQDLSSYGQEGDALVVIARLVVAFPLVDVDYAGIFKLLWDLSFSPHGLKELGQLLQHDWTSCFVHFSRDSVGSWCFATGKLLDSLSDFLFCG